jgi:hypothetical protein
MSDIGFQDRVVEFFDTWGKIYAPSTAKDKGRQFRRLDNVVSSLIEDGLLTTADPAFFAVDDFMNVAVSVRDTMNIQPDTRAHIMSKRAL